MNICWEYEDYVARWFSLLKKPVHLYWTDNGRVLHVSDGTYDVAVCWSNTREPIPVEQREAIENFAKVKYAAILGG